LPATSGLIVKRKTGYDYKVKGVFENFIYYQEGASFSIENCKPILRPMDLTKPITIDGKEVIPLQELALIVHGFGRREWKNRLKSMSIKNIKHSNIEQSLSYNDVGAGRKKFAYNFGWKGFLLSADNGVSYPLHINDQLALFKWLYANKFDVDGLIEKGLAIDVNTLEINPYNS